MGAEPALERLRDERVQIDELFDSFAEHQHDPLYAACDAEQLSELICTLLRVHDDLESTVLHPALASRPETQRAYERTAESRAAVRASMERLEALPPTDPEHAAQMRVLAEQARRWFADDEALFDVAQALPLDLSLLDSQLGRRQEALLSADDEPPATALH